MEERDGDEANRLKYINGPIHGIFWMGHDNCNKSD